MYTITTFDNMGRTFVRSELTQLEKMQLKADEKWAKELAKSMCCPWCNKSAWGDDRMQWASHLMERAQVQHYEWIADILEHHVPGEISVAYSILEYLFPVVYGEDSPRPFLLSPVFGMNPCYHLSCLTISCTTKSGRRSKAPERFEDLAFVKGSGVSGCDRFESGYDRGNFYDSEKFCHDLVRKPDSDFIVGENFDEVESLPSDEIQSLPSDEEEYVYSSSSEEEEWEESDYDSDE